MAVPAPPISRSASAASAGGSPMPMVRAVESSVSSRSSCALASSRSIAFASSGEVVGVRRMSAATAAIAARAFSASARERNWSETDRSRSSMPLRR